MRGNESHKFSYGVFSRFVFEQNNGLTQRPPHGLKLDGVAIRFNWGLSRMEGIISVIVIGLSGVSRGSSPGTAVILP